MELSGIEAISSLPLFLEQKDFLQTRHLIVAGPKDLDKLKFFLRFKKPKIPWYDLPPFPHPKSPWTKRILLQRRKWQTWANSLEPALFLSSPQALLKKSRAFLPSPIIREGEKFNPSLLKDYEEKAFIEREGEFSSRSFLMDIFSPAYPLPLRIQFFGDQIQSIHLLDKSFKKRETKLKQAFIPALYEWGWEGEDRKKLCAYLKSQEQKLGQTLPSDLFKSFSRGEMFFGFENLLNNLDQTCSLDYFPQALQIWLFEPAKAKNSFLEEQSHLEKEQAFFNRDGLFLSWKKLDKNINPIPHKQTLSRFKESGKLKINAESAWPLLIKLRASSPNTLYNQSQTLSSALDLKNFSSSLFKKTSDLKEDLKNLPVHHIVFVGEKTDKLKKILLKEGILNSIDQDFIDEKNLIFLKSQIKESFFCQGETAYLNIEDLIPQKKQQIGSFDFFRQKVRALEFSKLETGDLLVHKQHGIGEFAGLQVLDVQGKKEDFIVLKYKGGDKLFAPAYKANQIKKYSKKRSDQITKSLLDRLGNPKSWERKKSQAKKHIQSLAIELIELYRLRKQKKRKPFALVKKALDQFAKDFPWTETADQKRAIQEIMEDMNKTQPMDRLLTADTGFGKTEVALRAVFRALEDGCQVCFLAPTTVLTLQHFENFKTRFKNTAFRLALLNRFIPPEEKNSIFEQVKAGKIDFLIATHSVFSPQLSFKNLRLLVLDEEHRFGVRQKERLFRFRENMDVLSLSATPIPRTLNMALTGIKDVSVISQPPEKRKPVHIIIKGWNEGMTADIIQAVRREKNRGGQVLFVHNRVRTLYQRAEQIQQLFPDFKIATAQGRTKFLDKIMLDFFEKKYDILVSTNIIESGMDMPQANTLFIDRAHEMGLSQIYQLKGRVGRGAEQAYCYLLFPDKERLSVLAEERLGLLKKYAGLGGAFQLALHDLENRGAGSLFGSEQSGHLESLGEELYFEILNEQLKNQKEIFIEPEIRLPFSAGIPTAYIPEPRLRLVYYKSLSEAKGLKARGAIQEEMLEEFGPFPEELSALFFLLELRDICKKLLIKDFQATQKTISLTFHEQTIVSAQSLLEILEKRKGKMLGDQSCRIPLQKDYFIEETKEILAEFAKSSPE